MCKWNIFKKTKKVETIPHKVQINNQVQIGKDYCIKQEEENPFKRKAVVVQVKDIKEGWVLYAFYPLGGVFQNESMKETEFLGIYSPMEE